MANQWTYDVFLSHSSRDKEDTTEPEDMPSGDALPHPTPVITPVPLPTTPSETPEADQPERRERPGRPPEPASRPPYLLGAMLLLGLLATLWSLRHLVWRPMPLSDGVFLLLGSAIWVAGYWSRRVRKTRRAGAMGSLSAAGSVRPGSW